MNTSEDVSEKPLPRERGLCWERGRAQRSSLLLYFLLAKHERPVRTSPFCMASHPSWTLGGRMNANAMQCKRLYTHIITLRVFVCARDFVCILFVFNCSSFLLVMFFITPNTNTDRTRNLREYIYI